jgi:hypothetical protein
MTQNIRNQMQGRLTRLMAAISLVALVATSNNANARTLMDFLRALGNSIAHPQKKSVPPDKSGKEPANKTAFPTPSPTPSPSPLNEPKILLALAAPETKERNRDLPYAIPVPGKKGLVTSPFAPREGYIDVSRFPSGSEVKDQFSGRIFRTP